MSIICPQVYVEQPVGVGYSVASGVLSYDDAKAAADNLAFVKGFLSQFPQFKANDFMLTSESYGGHYLPTLAEAIVADGGLPKFKGFLVGNPITWLTYTNYGMYGTMHGHQLLPKPLWDEYEAASCRTAPGLDPGPICENITSRMDDLTAGLDPYGLDVTTAAAALHTLCPRCLVQTAFACHLIPGACADVALRLRALWRVGSSQNATTRR